MTQEEKAKAYDEALEKARMYRDNAKAVEDYAAVARYENIFPELRESEDERIRKWIASYIHHGVFTEDEHPMALKAVEWLEKQKESLHIPETCKENAEYFTSQCGDNRFELIDKAKRDIIAKTNIESSPDEMKVLDSFLFRAWQMGWLGKYDVIVPEQKPAWSEEDKEIMYSLRSFLIQAEQSGRYGSIQIAQIEQCLNWLKSLRPGWKPTEDQMMKDAVKWLVDDDYHEASEKGRFILGSVGIGYNGYYIPYSDLLKLPKENEK